MSNVRKLYGKNVRGLLGLDVHENFDRVEVNFREKKLRFSQVDSDRPSVGGGNT